MLQRNQMVARDMRQLAPQPVKRAGGPGQPGYVWNGPQTAETAPEDDAA